MLFIFLGRKGTVFEAMSESFKTLEHLKQKCLKNLEIVTLPQAAKQAIRSYVDELFDQIFISNPRNFTKYRKLTDEDIEYLFEKLEAQTKLIKDLQKKLKTLNSS